MNCLQALAVAAAALVASGQPVLKPLIDAPAYLERGETLLRAAAQNLEAKFEDEDTIEHRYARTVIRTPDSQIHTIRRVL